MSGTTFRRPCPPLPCPDHGTRHCPPKCHKWPHCADWSKKWHGSWFFAVRIEASGGRQLLRRGGFERQLDAQAVLDQAGDLIALGRGDKQAVAQIGDMIVARSKRGGTLPDTALVARRLGLGGGPDSPGITCVAAWNAWLAGKRKLRRSSGAGWSSLASTGSCR